MHVLWVTPCVPANKTPSEGTPREIPQVRVELGATGSGPRVRPCVILGRGRRRLPGRRRPVGHPGHAPGRRRHVRVTKESSTGKVGFIAARGSQRRPVPGGGRQLAPPRRPPRSAPTSTSSAPPSAPARVELSSTGSTPNALRAGPSPTSRSTRVYAVFGRPLKANVDKDGDLMAVTGFAAPNLNLSVDPRVTQREGRRRAPSRSSRPSPPTSEDGGAADTSGITAATPKLVVYRTGSVRGDHRRVAPGLPGRGRQRRQRARHGGPGRQHPQARQPLVDGRRRLDRELYENSPDTDPVWSEGDAVPGHLNADQQNLVTSAGELVLVLRQHLRS